MRILDRQLVFSASDLANFLECEYLTSLDLLERLEPDQASPRAKDSDEAELVQKHGFDHEAGYLTRLKADGYQIADLSGAKSIGEAVAQTLAAMHRGDEVIFQAALRSGAFAGYADFLRRVPGPSALGNWHYEVADTKLAKSPKAKFLIQLCFYAELVATIQGVVAGSVHLVFGDRSERSFRTTDYRHYFLALQQRFLAHVERRGAGTYPDPVNRCDLCHWRDACEARRIADDHLCQVANIARGQILKLNASGIGTLEALAKLPEEVAIASMAPESLARLRHQARLQFHKRTTGEDVAHLLPSEPGRGLSRLPAPDSGDVFFDMEGDPYEDGGLEYLFGAGYLDGGKFQFQGFWGHSRADERRAFEDFVDFATTRLAHYPGAHIYHYAAYEETALKRLMCLHGTRVAEVDHLLRTGKLIDLYKVVREGLRVSEPRYSIKNIETFYAEKREGEVKTAGASIVWYERWKETGDEQLLEDIRAYNEDDCRSTWQLRDWLLHRRPEGMPWASERETKSEEPVSDRPDDLRLEEYREAMLGALPEDRTTWTNGARARELAWQLLDFHRREAKPQWWAMFDRMEKSEDDLLEDIECLAGLVRDPAHPARADKRSLVHTYLFPEQETKLKPGDKIINARTGEPLNTIMRLDEDARRIGLRIGANREMPDRLSIGPGQPIGTNVLRDAIYRFADGMIGREAPYPVLEAILRREPPRVTGHVPDSPLTDESAPMLPQVIEAVAGLSDSYLFIQGPPGAGKTWTGSHVIAELLHRGLRIAVASNSHKAINNLLAAVENVAQEKNIRFRGAKKSTDNASFLDGRQIRDVTRADDISDADRLVAGTAWLFADERFDRAFDILFVDEAGQVTLANLVAMGTSARNIVLLGDPMQLGQPTQGTHPGHSGKSGLEYLLDARGTVAPDMGVFLPTTWRMAPPVCTFISEAVYDGRLNPEKHTVRQKLVLKRASDPVLREAGIVFVPVNHEGCSQKSSAEADRIVKLFANLMQQEFVDRDECKRTIRLDDILVVAPYNMQVNLLKQVLPEGARVGTVDKFQGQEAPVVIISMATSSGEHLPRDIGFLFSKNRLNVAISRAQCLAVMVASPKLTAVKCATVEQMALVNLVCRVAEEYPA